MTAALSSQELSDLIGRIYDCTLDPSRWEPTLDVMRNLLQCPTAQLALMDMRQHRLLIQKSLGMDAKFLEGVAKYYPEINYHVERVLDDGFSMEEPMILTRAFAPEVIANSPYMQEWGRPRGFCDTAQVNLMRTPTRLSVLGFGRYERDGVFDDWAVEFLRLLLPHLRRAVTISNVLDAQAIEKARMAETLDALKLGVVLADERSRILHANRAATSMMQDGGPLRDAGGVLRADGAASVEIKAAIGLAARNESGIGKTGLAVRLTEEDQAPVIAHVLPLAGGELRTRLDPTAVAAVFVNPAADDAEAARSVAAMFGLTPAETRVLDRILSGKTVAETAADLGVAERTARTHLEGIFRKTGVSRQTELLRLAARAAPPNR